MTGLIISNPPPRPVTASPVTNEHLFIKYLCKMIRTAKNTLDDPNP